MRRSNWMTSMGTAILAAALATGVAFAAGGDVAGPKASQGAQQLMTEIRSLRHSRMEQLRAEIEAKIDKAAADGKITADEATRLKENMKHFKHGGKWHHDLKGATEAEVKAKLDAAVKSGRMTQEQADQMLKRWQEWKAKQPSQANR